MPLVFCAISIVGTNPKNDENCSLTSSLSVLRSTYGFTQTIANVTPCSVTKAPSNDIGISPFIRLEVKV